MKITYELDLNTFQAWSGAVDTLERIKREGKVDELEAILEDTYPEGMSETGLNDLLWFDSEAVYEWLGLPTEDTIQAEIDELEEELDTIQEENTDMVDEWMENTDGMTEEEAKAYWMENYHDDWKELMHKKDELNDRIAELKEELENL